MTGLPCKLTRKAIKRCFDQLSEARWDYLFKYERSNGIHECRVEGPFDKAYYSTEALMAWLVTEGYYRPIDFNSLPGFPQVSVRTHVLAG